MCELFGASAHGATELASWLEPFRRRGGATADNPDGWGVAWWDTGTLRTEKAPEPGASSGRFAQLARRLRTGLLLAHVRKARHPPTPGMRNTHPFVHQCCGREWVFAHNGLVPDVIGTERSMHCRPDGETDSEHAFCHLLAELAGCYRAASIDHWMAQLGGVARTIAELGKFNFILSDGAFLIAYGHDRLHYLERPEGEPPLALVATEPLTAESWRAFARDELRVYRDGTLALRWAPPSGSLSTDRAVPAAVTGGETRESGSVARHRQPGEPPFR